MEATLGFSSENNMICRTTNQSSPDLLKSFREFPRQSNLTDSRSWFRLVNQLGNVSKDLTKIMEPFRPFLKIQCSSGCQCFIILKTMNQNSVELRLIIVYYCFPKANCSL